MTGYFMCTMLAAKKRKFEQKKARVYVKNKINLLYIKKFK
jgi:hypothetical protein